MIQYSKQGGFNLIQVLLVVAIFLVIASMTVPSLYQFQTGAQIDTVTAEISQNLRRAQSRAMVGYNDSNWGVYFTAGVYTIFSGDEYNTRDMSEDEDYTYSGSIQVINDFADQIVFSKITGIPDTAGTVTLSTTGNEQSVITINTLGVIEYR